MIEDSRFIGLTFIFAIHKNFIMKKIVICCFLVFVGLILYPQNKSLNKPVAKPVQKGTSAGLPLKTLEDSANYAMGMSVANFYRSQGISKMNATIVSRGINDALTGKKLLLNDM